MIALAPGIKFPLASKKPQQPASTGFCMSQRALSSPVPFSDQKLRHLSIKVTMNDRDARCGNVDLCDEGFELRPINSSPRVVIPLDDNVDVFLHLYDAIRRAGNEL